MREPLSVRAIDTVASATVKVLLVGNKAAYLSRCAICFVGLRLSVAAREVDQHASAGIVDRIVDVADDTLWTLENDFRLAAGHVCDAGERAIQNILWRSRT